jgi:pimeloyl-ACP methyl ester carboxylesterase
VRAGSVETVEVELNNGRRVEVVQTRLVSPPQRVIVVVAGNPGLARFYSRFVKELHERTGAHCLALGHTGHGGGTAPPVDPPLGLAAQIEDKRELLEKLAQRWPPGVEIMIAGHSIGAYMALHLLDTFPLLAKSRGFMLFPTVHHIGASFVVGAGWKEAWKEARKAHLLLLVLFPPLLIFVTGIFLLLFFARH